MSPAYFPIRPEVGYPGSPKTSLMGKATQNSECSGQWNRNCPKEDELDTHVKYGKVSPPK